MSHAEAADTAALPLETGALFGFLPSDLFRPLTNKYRHVYVELLRRLHGGLFSLDVVGAPAREEVMSEIEAVLSRHADALARHGLTASTAYNELKETGWLQEERVGWQVHVAMDQAVGHLLDVLCTLGERLGESFGEGTVGVLNHLQGAVETPETGVLGIAEARRRAVQFARSIRGVAANLRRIEGDLLRSATRDTLVDSFFQDFVERIHIGDYALLASRGNPYQFRHRILGIAAEIRSEPERRRALATALMAQGRGRSLEEAEARIDEDLSQIVLAFESIERAHALIDQTKLDIERRFVNSIRYMDLAGSDRSTRMRRSLARAGEHLAAVPPVPDHERVEVTTALRPAPRPVHELGAAVPTREREPTRPRRQRVPEPDPVVAAYERAKAEFDARMQVTPERVAAFARRPGKPAGSAADYPVECLEDALLFSALLSQAAQSGFRLPGLRIMPAKGRVDNGWIELTDFAVEREDDAEGA